MRCGPNLTPEREAVICGGTAETSGFGITMSQANPVFWVGGAVFCLAHPRSSRVSHVGMQLD